MVTADAQRPSRSCSSGSGATSGPVSTSRPEAKVHYVPDHSHVAAAAPVKTVVRNLIDFTACEEETSSINRNNQQSSHPSYSSSKKAYGLLQQQPAGNFGRGTTSSTSSGGGANSIAGSSSELVSALHAEVDNLRFELGMKDNERRIQLELLQNDSEKKIERLQKELDVCKKLLQKSSAEAGAENHPSEKKGDASDRSRENHIRIEDNIGDNSHTSYGGDKYGGSSGSSSSSASNIARNNYSDPGPPCFNDSHLAGGGGSEAELMAGFLLQLNQTCRALSARLESAEAHIITSEREHAVAVDVLKRRIAVLNGGGAEDFSKVEHNSQIKVVKKKSSYGTVIQKLMGNSGSSSSSGKKGFENSSSRGTASTAAVTTTHHNITTPVEAAPRGTPSPVSADDFQMVDSDQSSVSLVRDFCRAPTSHSVSSPGGGRPRTVEVNPPAPGRYFVSATHGRQQDPQGRDHRDRPPERSFGASAHAPPPVTSYSGSSSTSAARRVTSRTSSSTSSSGAGRADGRAEGSSRARNNAQGRREKEEEEASNYSMFAGISKLFSR